ncbi:sensor histidine kinase [Amycolatopsis magusensis]|uniref:sensor histidine kinase n=1 Tax=Amycolatopsis magusensis TaxID=882444 RepID=UPI0024A9A931|nr:HAMP domain-containing sensor histidine kinase [Amycolatopsis magusensis]MDI5979901.1 HAMP domain-containing sensor histidine kinase [Amycolatopsis magusensis]
MRRKRPGIRSWIVATVLSLTTAATAATALFAYQAQSRDVRERFATSASLSFTADLDHLASNDTKSPNWQRAVEASDFLERRYGIDFAIFDFSPQSAFPQPERTGEFYRANGAIAGYAPIDIPVPVMDAALRTPARTGVTPTVLSGKDSTYAVLGGVLRPGLVVVEFYNARDVDAQLADFRETLLWLATGIAAAAATLGLLAATLVQRSVNGVTSAARRFGAGDAEVRAAAVGPAEAVDLAHAFNHMADRVRDSIAELRAKEAQQRRLLADVAHDLRTPVATILAAAEGMEALPPEARARASRLLTQRAQRLAGLVDDLLEMSELDAGAAELRTDQVELADLAGSAADLIAPGAEVRMRGNATILADPRRLFTIMSNLLENALRHGEPPVDIDITSTSDRVLIRCQDSGPGIPEEAMDVLFDRFARADGRRGPAGGNGLGLAIAQANAQLHGGRIEAANTDRGACFTVELPVVTAEQG